ncbi:MAG: ATP-binding protein [Bacteroidales bacterium]|nr:ATP-binding protein [Candidatus Sodaliphilus aphodohippi]
MTNLEQKLRDQKDELQSTDFSNFVTRNEEQLIDLDSPLAQIVIGVRRSGKSTLCQKVLMNSGVRFAYLNCDDEDISSLHANELLGLQETLYAVYGNFTHLFIDEVQNLVKWPLFVNRLLRQHLRLIITGSNANLLSDELSTHITGRYNEIRLYPFSFEDYCKATDTDTSKLTTQAIGVRRNALYNYLMEGGMPETIGMERPDKYLHSILDAIINKDICRRYKVRYKNTLQQLANTMLDRSGQEITFSEVQSTFRFASIHTAKDYVSYINKANLIRLVPRFSFKSIERQTARKVYAVDNAFITTHNDVIATENLGWRLENAVAIELYRRMEYASQQLFYLRENRNYEVDFAVADQNRITELIQVTYNFTKPTTKLYNREINGLIKGARATRCNKLTLIMMDGKPATITVGDYSIRCILAVDWFLNKQS